MMQPAPQDLFNIAPKRPNWDLKRELDKKLAKLERKTQESIHTLIRAYYRHLILGIPAPLPRIRSPVANDLLTLW